MSPFPEVRKRKSKRNTPKLWKCQKDGHFTFELAAYLSDTMTRAWVSEGQLAREGARDYLLKFMVAKKYGRSFLDGLEVPELGTREGRCDHGLWSCHGFHRWGEEAGSLKLIACQYQLKCSGNE